MLAINDSKLYSQSWYTGYGNSSHRAKENTFIDRVFFLSVIVDIKFSI